MASENYVVDEELLRMRDILLRRTLTYQIFQLYLKYEDKLQTAQLILVEIALPAFILGINRLSFGWKTTAIRLVFFMCLVFVVYVSAMSGLRKKYLNYDGKVAQVLARTAFFVTFLSVILHLLMGAVVIYLFVRNLEFSIPVKVAVACPMAAPVFLLSGKTVESLYVPLRGVSYVDSVFVARTLQSFGLSLIPSAFVLIAAHAGFSLEYFKKFSGSVVGAGPYVVSAITSVITSVRKQGQWLDSYREARESVESQLDKLTASVRDKLHIEDSARDAIGSLPDSDELSQLIELLRSGASVGYFKLPFLGTMPLVPEGNFALFLVVRICCWPMVAQALLAGWKSALDRKVVPEKSRELVCRGRWAEAEYVAACLMGEIANLSFDKRKSIQEILERMCEIFESREVKVATWKECVAADGILRETIVGRHVIVR